MSRYVVTGCAGLIGSQVTHTLLSNGHSVIGIDSLNKSYDERLKNWRVDQFKNDPMFDFHIADIRDANTLKYIFNNDINAVINLAAKAGVRQSLIEPLQYYETNVIGTVNLLEMCRTFNIKKFVLASTSSLYGDKSQQPLQETTDTNSPLSPYSASKKAAEAICYTYHHLYNIDITIPRYFTVYGPAGRPDMAIFKFIQWIAEGIPITIFGDGEQTRDFTYVDDIAKGTILSLKQLGYETINLGSDKPVSVNTCISLIEECLHKSAQKQYLPRHPADVQNTWANISKAKDLLEWQPRTDLREGIKQTVNWYLENQSWVRTIITS
ncbi:MAG: nucleotide sugar epimerase [Dehalococcoidia bacterium]|nr:nucleotide sugar epimerase [Dehalococcoidia bacterium]|tara:strand:- start:1930 stop:2901 length:972 start_codon:yes stop_codon:yes gene_type:complete